MARPRTRYLHLVLVAALIAGVVGVPAVGSALYAPRDIAVVSVGQDGTTQEGYSYEPAISDDGRYVAFYTWEALVAEDTDSAMADVYRRDTLTGTTELVTVGSDGGSGSGAGARAPQISDDGRYVAFRTGWAFDPADTGDDIDVYVRDMTLAYDAPGAYTWLEATSDGDDYRLSGDGSTVVWTTWDDIDAADTNSYADVYAVDVATGVRTFVSAPTIYTDSIWWGSRLGSVTDDGRYILFLSGKDLTEDDPDLWDRIYVDFFLYDMDTAAVVRVPVRDYLDGWEGNDIEDLQLSGDGSAFAFETSSDFDSGTGYYRDIWRYDLQASADPLMLVSAGNNWYGARDSQISDDGNQVFLFTGETLAPEDTDDGEVNMYVYDVAADDYVVVNGWVGDGWSRSFWTGEFAMSGDGTALAFETYGNLVPEDDNSAGSYNDVYVTTIPAPLDDAYTVNEDLPLAGNVLSNDPGGTSLSAVLVSGASNGTLNLGSDGFFTYFPGPNYNGSETFTYRPVDALGAEWATATVTITIDPVNDAPAVSADGYAAVMDQVLTVAAPGVLGNDADPEGDPMTAAKFTDPAHGTVVVNADGSFTYTPTAGYVGTDSFTYKASDGTAESTAATVNITVVAGSAPGPVMNAVYRFFNTGTGAHLYTATAAERDSVLRNYWSKFIYEGIAYYADESPTGMPLYRFYNKWSGTHFYTASATEKASVESLYPTVYTYEGVAYNVSLDAKPGYVPVYRFYNAKTRAHFYTASAAEKDTVIAQFSGLFTYEGIAFYVIP